MPSRVRVFDCPACGVSEFILRVHRLGGGVTGGAESTQIACADCGHAVALVRGLGLEPNRVYQCRATVFELPLLADPAPVDPMTGLPA